MLHAKVEDRETISLIEGAAAGMVATIDAHGTDAVQDWEVSATFHPPSIEIYVLLDHPSG